MTVHACASVNIFVNMRSKFSFIVPLRFSTMRFNAYFLNFGWKGRMQHVAKDICELKKKQYVLF